MEKKNNKVSKKFTILIVVLSILFLIGIIIAFAGIDSPPDQSGQVDKQSKPITKRGSASLRKTLFQVITVILQKSPQDEPVYTYLDKKRSEGKPYKVYMIAAANKFLRIYYARAKECLVNT